MLAELRTADNQQGVTGKDVDQTHRATCLFRLLPYLISVRVRWCVYFIVLARTFCFNLWSVRVTLEPITETFAGRREGVRSTPYYDVLRNSSVFRDSLTIMWSCTVHTLRCTCYAFTEFT